MNEIAEVEVGKPSTALAIPLDLTKPTQLFVAKGCDPLIESIRQQAEAVKAKLDISTPKGRKQVASAAYTVSRVKQQIDDTGQRFVADLKAQVKVIDEERARVWDAVEAIQKELRAPLDEWEAEEKARTDANEAVLREVAALCVFDQPPSVEFLRLRLERLATIRERDWREFKHRAGNACDAMKATLDTALESAIASEAEAAAKEQERIAKQIQARKEREEKIRKEAAEKAEREKAEAVRKLEERRIADHRFAIDRMKMLAKASPTESVELLLNRTDQLREFSGRTWEEFEDEGRSVFSTAHSLLEAALAAAKEREAEAERVAKEYQEAVAKRMAALAVENERKAREAARKAEEDAQAKRENNRRHRDKIHREVHRSLQEVFRGIPGDAVPTAEGMATVVLEALKANYVVHVQISY